MSYLIRCIAMLGLVSVIPAPVALGQQISAEQALRASIPYLQRRKHFTTKLTKHGPAPLTPKAFDVPDGWFEVKYSSTDDLQLKAWLHKPKDVTFDQPPGIVYFHGNFAVHGYDFEKCKPFIDAGFVVLLPALRGENRNPGDCELFLGEVEDGINAVRWLARQKFVDRERLYTFGHSAGGVISAMLSLHDDLPIRLGGSSGGLYGYQLFDAISDRVPFDLQDPMEREMRVLPGNIRWMKRPHVAFAGDADGALRPGVQAAEAELRTVRAPKLRIVHHPGNHNSALPDAMQRFLKMIEDKS